MSKCFLTKVFVYDKEHNVDLTIFCTQPLNLCNFLFICWTKNKTFICDIMESMLDLTLVRHFCVTLFFLEMLLVKEKVMLEVLIVLEFLVMVFFLMKMLPGLSMC